MRIWSLHPKYLDSKGIVALWRETLLAQKVLRGKTKGYKNHPQLNRFKKEKNPLKTIGSYLRFVVNEADRRGYQFDASKIFSEFRNKNKFLKVNREQLHYEFKHLLSKLKDRDPKKYREIKKIKRIQAHPIFHIKPGKIEEWEIL